MIRSPQNVTWRTRKGLLGLKPSTVSEDVDLSESKKKASTRILSTRSLFVAISLALSFLAYGWWTASFATSSAGHSLPVLQTRLPSPPGLRTPPTRRFHPIPPEARKVVCIDKYAWDVLRRAFRSRDWKIVSDMPWPEAATIVWTTLRKDFGKQFEVCAPWQRINSVPEAKRISDKGSLFEEFHDYEQETGRTVDFLPETYMLHRLEDARKFLKRLQQGGMSEAWFLKMMYVDQGKGVRLLGPGSDGLGSLRTMLRDAVSKGKPEQISAAALKSIIASLILVDQSKKEKERHIDSRGYEVVIQHYVQDPMMYKGRKMDLRVYFLVASMHPLVVFYHDRYLRVAPKALDDSEQFNSRESHVTNLHSGGESVAFSEWDFALKEHAASRGGFSPEITRDPLQHIRNQLKSALASLVTASRDHFLSFNGTAVETSFALMGVDFVVDRDLKAWLIEANISPSLGAKNEDDLGVQKRQGDQMLPAAVDILDKVIEMQTTGKPLFPVDWTGAFELIYTDDYQYEYK